MAYSEATVLAGGLVHIPILIGLVGFFERFRNAISKKSGKTRVEEKKSVQPPEKSSPTPKAVKKPAHPNVPVNTYKPKSPFEGTVTENYSLLKDGAIGRVNHITFDLADGNPQLKYVEGQSIWIVPAGTDSNGKTHKIRL